MNRRVIGAIGGAVVAVLIWAAPAIGQLDPVGQRALAVVALGVAFWAADVLNSGITALMCIGLLLVARVPASTAFAGFAAPAFWILVGVLFFGRAMDKTGLARRISYRILLAFRPTYTGILFAFLAIGFVLALGIPSMTVRTAIMVPIAWALVQALGLPLPGPGSALILLTTFEMAVLPGCALLTGALWGPYLAGLYATAKLPLSWLGYARVMTVPTIVWCVLVVVANRMILRPAPLAASTRDAVDGQMKTLGAMSRDEWLTAAIVSASVLAWASQPWHRVPAEAIGLLALSALFASGVLAPAEIGTGIPWGLALFVGGMLSVSSVITTFRISDWAGGFIVQAVQPFVANPFLFVAAMAVAVVLMRFIDPVGFITIAAFFLSLAGFVSARGLDPLVLVGAIFLPLHVFWFTYQNIWIVMTDGITAGRGYTGRDRMALGTSYFGVTLVSLWLAVVYWKLVGVI